MNTKPAADEYAPYYEKYISLIPDGDIVSVLREQLGSTVGLFRGISEEKAVSRYAPGKWSIKELLGHLIDTERIFSYRALRIARNDKTPLPGFEQDDYIANAHFDALKLSDLIDEFETVRKSGIYLYKGIRDEDWLRRGVASNAEVSVRALAYMTAGHVKHHVNILQERYLV